MTLSIEKEHSLSKSDDFEDLSSSVQDNIIDLSNSNLMPTDPTCNAFQAQTIGTEILVYCQNFNRMKSSIKIREIHKRVVGCSYSIILANETSWDDSIKSEE